MVRALTMFTKEILPNQDPERPRCHCPTIAQSPGGDLIIAWYAYPQEETKGGVLMLTRRRAGNSRFDRPQLLESAFPRYTHYHCTMDERLFVEYGDLLRKARFLFTLTGRPFRIPIRFLGSEGFSFDLEKGVYSGYTVSYLAPQLAVYMGFKKVFYVGLDLRHDKGQTHFFGKDRVSENQERTEFPRMIRMLEPGAQILSETDVKVYNRRPVSTLSCFEPVTLKWAADQPALCPAKVGFD